MRTLIAWLLLASACLAQTQAVIDGPAMALPGELVVLSSANSKGDNHKWIPPEGVSTAVAANCANNVGSQIFFATPKLGEYKFILIVSDKSAAIEYATHTVLIKHLTPPPPPPPIDPVPVPPPVGDFAQLKELSRVNSLRLNDPATRASLAKNLQTAIADMRSQCAAGQCPTLTAAKARIVRTIEDTLLMRPRESRGTHWEEAWRVPNNQYLVQLQITQTPVYLNAFAAIVAGLE